MERKTKGCSMLTNLPVNMISVHWDNELSHSNTGAIEPCKYNLYKWQLDKLICCSNYELNYCSGELSNEVASAAECGGDVWHVEPCWQECSDTGTMTRLRRRRETEPDVFDMFMWRLITLKCHVCGSDSHRYDRAFLPLAELCHVQSGFWSKASAFQHSAQDQGMTGVIYL